ncbi:E3 ubiquitin-protein ligase XIAP-like isoform X2 [Pecten maximus]|uniref:E3 ubiquitin-protein ligase XIAP-like isoform X2 n=1 Tax=Pecten maximus TaxID=6579 RepID=UPI001458415F|nr:E3 ubiquitin-protein ligase XIAP-like isoform X2 [Pecten maximus]
MEITTISNILQRRTLFCSARKLRLKSKTAVYVHILFTLLLHYTTTNVLCKQLRNKMVCVLERHIAKEMEKETSEQVFLFILKLLLFVDSDKVQNGNINIYQLLPSHLTVRKKWSLNAHIAYDRNLLAYLQGRERRTKQLPFPNRTIEKFIPRRKMYKNICLSKESDIVNGKQITSLLCVLSLSTTTEDLIREMCIGHIYIDFDSTGQSYPRLSALHRYETQIRTTLKCPRIGTDTRENCKHNFKEVREKCLKHDRTLYQTRYLSKVSQTEILSKTITEIYRKENFSVMPQKKWSYQWDIKIFQDIQIYPVQQYSLEQAFTLFGEGRSTFTNPEVFFSNYLMRLSSYRQFQSERAPSAIKLSKAGFYSTGNKDETACFHCGCRYSSWCLSEDPIEIHREISPRCEFIQEIHSSESCDRKTPLPSVTKGTQCSDDKDTSSCQHLTGDSLVVYGNEQNHFRDNNALSHDDSSPTDRRTSLSVANSTGDFKQTNDVFNYHNGYRQTCQVETKPNTSFCNVFESISVDNTPSTGSLAVPSKTNPTLPSTNCSTELTLLNGNSDWPVKEKDRDTSSTTFEHGPSKHPKDSDTYDTTSVNGPKKQPNENKLKFVHPLFPKYQSLLVRMSSFAKWPTNLTQTAKQMAVAGFFYKGYGDAVVCFWCGVNIVSWEDEDEPCLEHVKWQPLCPFIIQTKGQDFVNLVQEEQRRSFKENGDINDYNVAEQTLTRNDTTKMRNYDKLKEMGFEQEKIHHAAQKISRHIGNPTDEDILEQLLNDGTQGETNETLPNAEVPRDQVLMYPTTRYNYPATVDNEDEEDHLRRLERLMCKICMTQEIYT